MQRAVADGEGRLHQRQQLLAGPQRRRVVRDAGLRQQELVLAQAGQAGQRGVAVGQVGQLTSRAGWPSHSM